jgi:hypothetical protein
MASLQSHALAQSNTAQHLQGMYIVMYYYSTDTYGLHYTIFI